MESLEQLRQQAVSLGLEESKIAEFVIAQQNLARDERSRQRELEKLKLEDAQKQRDHEVEMARLASNNTNLTLPAVKVERPKLPSLKDGDDVTSYFVRFERVCQLLQLEENSFVVRLASLLEGRAAEIYSSLPPEITADYGLLKEAILAGFRKNYDTYRSEFRAARVGSDETYAQFVTTLSRKLDFWISSTKIEKTYQHLRDFIILDQLLAGMPNELRLFLKEKGHLSLADTAAYADNWSVAHKIKAKNDKIAFKEYSQSFGCQ